MKKCTTCGKTFDDNMKFCQIDGTLLVEVMDSTGAAESEDPYKTIVGGLDKLPVPPEESKSDVSDAPAEAELDPMQTMVVSPEELRKELDQMDAPKETPQDEMPPIETPPFETPSADVPPPPSPFDSPAPPEGDAKISEPADFNEPDVSPPNLGETFEQPGQNQDRSDAAPIPSPFDESMVGYKPPPVPQQPYKEAEIAEIKAEALNTPYADEVNAGNQQIEQSDWSPPPAPDASWQNQQIGQNSAFQTPPTSAEGENKTMAIIALVSGILSCLCCFPFITGPLGLILGFIAKGKVDENPAEYGGRSFALAGMITGGIGTVIGVAVIILQIFFGILGNIG